MKTKLVLLFFFFSSASFSQITFQKALGGEDGARSIEQTFDGGYIVAGSVYLSGYGIRANKLNNSGDTVWSKRYSASGYAYSVKQTSDSGFIFTGFTTSIGAGGDDVFLIKTDSNGNILWSKAFGGANYDHGNSLQQTIDGGYIISGTTQFGSGIFDVYLVKTNAAGNVLWSKTFGGTNFDEGLSGQQTTDSGYVVAGYTSSFGVGGKDFYLVKTDTLGNLLWSKTFGGSADDVANGVQQTADGGYILAGTSSSFGSGGDDVFLVKTDGVGNLIWSKSFGGANSDRGNAVQQTTDGGYIIAGATFGTTNFNSYLIKTDNNGTILWSKSFGTGGSTYAYTVQQTSDNGYVIAGNMPYQFYVIKTDSLGFSGCNESVVSSLTVIPSAQAGTPSTITSAPATITSTAPFITYSGNIAYTLCSSIGISEETERTNNFSLSPNPATSTFTISDLRFTILEIEMYNVMGEKVFSENQEPGIKNQVTIDVSDLIPGVYFVKLINEQGSVTRKLVVQR